MNIRDFVNVFSREEIESNRVNIENSNILFPKNLYEATKEMCRAPKELRGFILAEEMFFQNKKFYITKFFSKLGYENISSAYTQKNRLKALETLSSRNKEKIIIDFHTHQECLGNEFHSRFSEQDFPSLINAVNRQPLYKHVLFTPTHILTFGLDKPTFIVLNLEESIKNYERFNEEHNSILKNLDT